MTYSNNYSKYIEKLKLEKSRKNFQLLVQNSQETKSEEIVIDDVFVGKSDNVYTQSVDSLSEKDRNNLVFEDNYAINSSSKKINGNDAIINPNEYSAISTKVELNNPEKGQNQIDAELLNSEPSSKNLFFEDEGSRKDGADAARVIINDKKDDEAIGIESEIASKNKIELEYGSPNSSKEVKNIDSENLSSEKLRDDINFNDPNSEKDVDDVSKEIINSEKSRNDISRERVYSRKSTDELIFSIKQEKKSGRSISNNEFGKKVEGEFAYLVAYPKKNEITNLNKQYSYFNYYPITSIIDSARDKSITTDAIIHGLDPKTYEEMEYRVNADKYKYYPFGSYEEINSRQSGAISDAFGTIVNASNWESPGKVLVNSLKVATDVVDMINVAGASRNIYREGVNANNIRWKLEVDDKSLKDDKIGEEVKGKIKGSDLSENLDPNEGYKFYNFVDPYSRIKKDDDENGIGGVFEDSNGQKYRDPELSYYADAEKENDEISGKYYNEEWGQDDEVTNFSEISGGRNALIWTTDSTDKDNPNVQRGHQIENTVNVEDKIRKQTGDEDGNLANETSKDEKSFIGEENKVDDGEGLVEIKKQNGNFAYTTSRESYSDRWYDDYSVLGNIYVIPPYNQLANTDRINGDTTDNKIDAAFVIPLQNNLQFEQISRAASYNAISFFGRIGDVQQYSKTGSLELMNLTTKYFVEDDEPNGNFTMSKLQDIEMMYRSLVLPVENSANYLSGDDSSSAYYYFTRPPLINIVLNSEGVDEGNIQKVNKTDLGPVYNNLFTEIVSRYNTADGVGKYDHYTFFKNFVVTNVSIDKNDNDYNYYVEYDEGKETGVYYDKMGFTVTLTVLEIDENYLGSIPSFNNYYNTVASRSKNFIGSRSKNV